LLESAFKIARSVDFLRVLFVKKLLRRNKQGNLYPHALS